MAFDANDRVRVTSQNSEYREKSGTVEVPAASSSNGYNKVRIDGHPVGKTANFADGELVTTNFPANVQY